MLNKVVIVTPPDIFSYYNTLANYDLFDEDENLRFYLRLSDYKPLAFQPQEITRGTVATYTAVLQNLYEFQLEIFDSRSSVTCILREIFSGGQSAVIHDYVDLRDRTIALTRDNQARGYAIRRCQAKDTIEPIGGSFDDFGGYGLLGLGTRVTFAQVDNL